MREAIELKKKYVPNLCITWISSFLKYAAYIICKKNSRSYLKLWRPETTRDGGRDDSARRCGDDQFVFNLNQPVDSFNHLISRYALNSNIPK